MKLKKTVIIIFLFYLFPISLLNSRPSRKHDTKFYIIKSKHFDIIFENFIYKDANRLANSLDTFFPYLQKEFGNLSIPRSPVLVKNRNADINGAVETYPYRMWINYHYPQCRDINLTVDWLTLTTLHESRHVIQNYLYYKKGYSAVVYSLLGIRNIFAELPDWFSEGDAVYQESILTNGGRGRSASFCNLLRYLILENKIKSYDKVLYTLSADSRKIFDHYCLGYHLICHLRRKYGNDIINKIAKLLPTAVFNILPFDVLIHKLTKKYMGDIYNDMISELKTLWEQRLINFKETSLHNLTNSDIDDYERPKYTSNDDIIAFKNGPATMRKLVIIQNNKEKVLTQISSPEHGNLFSVAKDKIAWSEEDYGPILGIDNTCFSIRILDLKTKKIRKITSKQIYKAPCLSPSAKKVVAIKSNFKLEHFIEILDSKKGKIIKTFKNQENVIYICPTWMEDEENIICIKSKNHLNALVIKNIASGKEEYIIPYTKDFIDSPLQFNDYILFTSCYNGIDAIYAVHIKTKKIYQIIKTKYGAAYPSLSPDKKYFVINNFTNKSQNIARVKINIHEWIPIEQVKDRRLYYFKLNDKLTPLNQFKKTNIKALKKYPIYKISKLRYRKKKYSLLKQFLSIEHLPIWFYDLETKKDDQLFSLKINFKNIMDNSSLEGNISKSYITGNNMISLGYNNSSNLLNYSLNILHEENHSKTKIHGKKGNITFLPSISLPCKILTNNGFIKIIEYKMETKISANLNTRTGYISEFSPFQLKFFNTKIKAPRDSNYRWGQKFYFNSTAYFDRNNQEISNELYGVTHLFFPGFFEHHSLHLLMAGRIMKNCIFVHNSRSFTSLGDIESSFKNTRSFIIRNSEKILNFHLLYDMPIWFANIPIGPLAYVYRINLRFFLSQYIDFDNEEPEGIHKPYFDSIGAWILIPDISVIRLKRLKINLWIGGMAYFDRNDEKWKFNWDWGFSSNFTKLRKDD